MPLCVAFRHAPFGRCRRASPSTNILVLPAGCGRGAPAPGGGCKTIFEAYASYRVRGAILDYLRVLDPLSRKLRGASRRITSAAGELLSGSGRMPQRGELAAELGLSLSAYQDLLGEIADAGLRSVELGAGGEPIALDPSPEATTARAELQTTVASAIEEAASAYSWCELCTRRSAACARLARCSESPSRGSAELHSRRCTCFAPHRRRRPPETLEMRRSTQGHLASAVHRQTGTVHCSRFPLAGGRFRAGMDPAEVDSSFIHPA